MFVDVCLCVVGFGDVVYVVVGVVGVLGRLCCCL